MERSPSTAVFLPFLSNQARRMSPRAPPVWHTNTPPRPKKRPVRSYTKGDVLGDRKRGASCFQALQIQRLGHQSIVPQEKQVALAIFSAWPRCQPALYLFGIQRPNIDTLLLGIKGVWFGGSTFRWDFTHPPVAGRRPTSMSIDVPPADSTAAATAGSPKPTTNNPGKNSQIPGCFAQI